MTLDSFVVWMPRRVRSSTAARLSVKSAVKATGDRSKPCAHRGPRPGNPAHLVDGGRFTSMSQLDFFEVSDGEWKLEGMARLPTASWLSDFLACEGTACHPWEEPDAYLQAIFDHGTGVHEASATRYVGLDPIVEPNSRIDIESRVGAALIPELEPISEAGVVEAAFELLPDKVVAHVPANGQMPRKAQHGGLLSAGWITSARTSTAASGSWT